MARILFDFECFSCSKVFEELIRTDNHDPVACTWCGSTSTKRMISAPRIDPRLGLDPDGFPTMGDKWARKHKLKPNVE